MKYILALLALLPLLSYGGISISGGGSVTESQVVAAGAATSVVLNGVTNVASGGAVNIGSGYLTNGIVSITSNLTVGGSITAGSYDPYEASTDLLPLVVNGTCTLSRAMGRSLKIDQTGTVYFTMDTAIPTNGDYYATLNIRTNGATWGFVAGVITNTATIVNGWTSIILHRGFNGTIVKGVSGQ